jgi:hypothetical protein
MGSVCIVPVEASTDPVDIAILLPLEFFISLQFRLTIALPEFDTGRGVFISSCQESSRAVFAARVRVVCISIFSVN